MADVNDNRFELHEIQTTGRFGDVVANINSNFRLIIEAILKKRDGKSAYELWVEQPGNEGKTLNEFFASLKESGFSSKAVLELPTGSNIEENTIYAVPEKSNQELADPDMWAEYIRQDGSWILMSRHPGSGLSSIIADIESLITQMLGKLDSEPESDRFYVLDADGNIIAIIDKNGISSVDFLVGEERRSLVTMIAEEILNRINADDALSARINTLSERKLDREIDDDNLVITDNNGYIVARIDKNGVKSVKDKHAVASMVIGDNFYPLSAPVRNDDGQVTSAHVMFGTGVEGNIAITYNNGLSTSASIIYGTSQYAMTINRDEDGQVTSVLVE